MSLGVGAGLRFLASSLCRFGQPAYGEAVPDVPSDAW